MDSTYYNGAMEEVMFDGKPLGLWNFVAGENNFKGAIERSVSARFSLELQSLMKDILLLIQKFSFLFR